MMAAPGLTEAGLGALHDRLAAHVDGGRLPGLVALVASGAQVHVEAIGTQGFDDRRPMGSDSIVRIASLTKPVVAAAAMVLVDEGVLTVHDSIERWLPELADRRVLRGLASSLDDTVPAERSITVEDVLTYRIGFGIVMAMPDTYPIQSAEREMQLDSFGPPWPPSGLDADAWMRNFARLPLIAQPGTAWMYNTSGQVLGVLVERAAGTPLEDFMRERLFDPLGMVDTGFSFPAANAARCTTLYTGDDPARPEVLDAVETSWWREPPAMANAAGWLLSTLDDYWSFVRMILAGGRHGERRILSAESVASMTTDHLTVAERAGQEAFLGDSSWGYGLAVPVAGRNTDAIPGGSLVPGGFGWDGGSGTAWRSDVTRGITGILLTQRELTSPEGAAVFADFWDGAYSSLATAS